MLCGYVGTSAQLSWDSLSDPHSVKVSCWQIGDPTHLGFGLGTVAGCLLPSESLIEDHQRRDCSFCS